jgi:hypothetical protein
MLQPSIMFSRARTSLRPLVEAHHLSRNRQFKSSSVRATATEVASGRMGGPPNIDRRGSTSAGASPSVVCNRDDG